MKRGIEELIGLTETIASGVVEAQAPKMIIAAESGTADTLDTLTAADQTEVLLIADAGDTITISTAGNFAAAGTLTDSQYLKFSRASASDDWVMVGGSGSGLGIYRSAKIPAGMLIPAITNGATFGQMEKGTNKNNYDYFEFSAATQQYAQFVWKAPDEWDRGTVKVKLHWTNGTAGTGDVVWGAQGVAISNDDALDVAFGTAQEVTDTFIADGDNHVTAATAAITVGGTPAASDLVTFQIYRKAADGADTYTQAARLLAVEIQWKESATIPAIW